MSAHLTTLDGGTEKDGQDRPNQRHIAAEVDGTIASSNAVRYPATRAEDLRCRMDRKLDRSRAGLQPAAETTREVGWYSPMQRWMRQAQAKSMAGRLRAAVASHRTPPISTTNRRCWAVFLKTAGDPEHPVSAGVRRRSLSRPDDELAAARDTVWSITLWFARSSARKADHRLAGQRLSVAGRRAGNTRGGFLERAGAGARLRALDMRTTLVDLDITLDSA